MLPESIGSSSTPSPPMLTNVGLHDYLEVDPRPSFIVNLKSRHGDDPSGLKIAYANHAFHRDSESSGECISVASLEHPNNMEIQSFVSWAKSTSDNNYFEYHGSLWTMTTVAHKWRIFSGTPTLKCSRDEDDGRNGEVTNGHTTKDSAHDASQRSKSWTAAHLETMNPSGNTPSKHACLVRDFDWANTSLGPMSTWPRPLLQQMPYLLSNPEPCCLFWGNDRTLIYNESFVDLIQDFHPAAMGRPARVSWAAIWDYFELRCQEVEQTKRAVKLEAVPIQWDRSRGLEEAFFSCTLIPTFDSMQRVVGIFNHASEVTKDIVTQRQMNILNTISNKTSSATTLDDFWRSVFDSVQDSTIDLPFVAVYALDNELLVAASSGVPSSKNSNLDIWHLEGSVGLPEDHPAMIENLDINGNAGLAPAFRLQSTNAGPFVIKKGDTNFSDQLFEGYVDRGAGTTFSQMVVAPLSLSLDRTAAYIVLGINPLYPYNDGYSRFVHLLSRQLEDTATSIVLLLKEKQHLERTVQRSERQRQWLSAQLQQQIREAQQSDLRFYNFAKQAPVGVYVLGREGEVKYSNEAWYNILGIPVGTLEPKSWMVHVHPDDVEATDQQWQALLDGHSQYNFEWRAIPHPGANGEQGEVVYLRSSCFPELGEDGSMESCTGILMDVSVHKAHERAVADRLANALEAKRAQENFMDMVSHEMRNPLNAMLQCAEEASQLLEQLDAAADVLEVVETIQYCGRHQKQIIDDVLTISKLDSNLLSLYPEEVAPINIINRVVKIFASEFRTADIDVSQKFAQDRCDVPYIMDSGRVLQILINLVGNAVKFLKDRPIRNLVLSVGTAMTKPDLPGVTYVPSHRQRVNSTRSKEWGTGDPAYVYFSVTDTGPGLSPEEMESLFARFKQASPRTHAQYGGSGLGLFISREIVEMHGGEIGLGSEVSQGSTFAFYIESHVAPEVPSIPKRLPERGGTKPVAENAITTTKTAIIDTNVKSPAMGLNDNPVLVRDLTVLVVEDNLVNQKVLQRQLNKLGCKTITANHGQEALDIIQHSHWGHDRKYDTAAKLSIVLCDLEMPVMDGMTCVRQVRQRQCEGTFETYIPMIAVTGNARVEQINAAKEAGFDDVVCKPYSVPDLVPLMQSLVQAPRQTDKT